MSARGGAFSDASADLESQDTPPEVYVLTANNNNNNENKHAHTGHLNSFAHLRALLILCNRDILANLTSFADWRSLIAQL